MREADDFYAAHIPGTICRRRAATSRARPTPGCSWSKQFYHYVVHDWLEGDPGSAAAARSAPSGAQRATGRTCTTATSSRCPTSGSIPWYAAWDLAFHMIPFAAHRSRSSPRTSSCCCCASGTCTRTGRFPAYEFALRRRESAGARLGLLARLQDDRTARRARPRLPRARVPEAADQLHLVGQPQGRRRQEHLRRRLPRARQHRRLRPLAARCPTAGTSSRPTARRGWRSTAPPCCRWRWSWRSDDPAYEDMASKFFEHFVAIADAMNTLGGTGLWDEKDGFYYDQLADRRHRARPAARALAWSA